MAQLAASTKTRGNEKRTKGLLLLEAMIHPDGFWCWFFAGLCWSLPVSLFCTGFVLVSLLVSAGLGWFHCVCLVLCGFGLVADSFAVFFGFVNFVLVSAALAAFCLVLGWSLPVSLFCAGFALLC